MELAASLFSPLEVSQDEDFWLRRGPGSLGSYGRRPWLFFGSGSSWLGPFLAPARALHHHLLGSGSVLCAPFGSLGLSWLSWALGQINLGWMAHFFPLLLRPVVRCCLHLIERWEVTLSLHCSTEQRKNRIVC
jgi:hypothetical protein